MRYYSSTAGAMTLAADVGAGDTTLQVSTVVGLPASFPYTLILDPGGSEEIVTVTAGSGTTLTVTRASDGTSAQAHSLGDPVRHGISARDLREPQEHIAATSDVHGVTGNLVGETGTQTLDNKTFLSSGGATTPLRVRMHPSQSTDLVRFEDSDGTAQWTLNTGTLSSDAVIVRTGAAANFWKRAMEVLSSAVDVVGIRVRGYAGQTADLQQWQKSDGTVLSSIDKAGRLRVNDTTADTVAARITATGAADRVLIVKGDPAQTGRLQEWFKGASVKAYVDSEGILGAAGASFSGDVAIPANDVTIGDSTSSIQKSFRNRRKATSGANTYESLNYLTDGGTIAGMGFVLKENGSEVNRIEAFPDGTVQAGPPSGRIKLGGVSNAKASKRIHWDVATVSTDSSGYALVTHGAGFTPSAVIITPSTITWRVTVDNFTSTTFRVRTFNGTGAAVPLAGVTLSYLCGE